MPITVLLFASYADALGRSSVEVELPAASTVRDVVRAVRELAGPAALPPEPLVAVNHAYAGPDRVVAPGDEVAIVPPVAGG